MRTGSRTPRVHRSSDLNPVVLCSLIPFFRKAWIGPSLRSSVLAFDKFILSKFKLQYNFKKCIGLGDVSVYIMIIFEQVANN
jgi:hypothetical protein